VEGGGLEQKIFAMVAAVESDPVHGAFGNGHLFGGEPGEADADDHGVLQTGIESGGRAVKIAAGIVFFEWSHAGGEAIESDGGAGRVAGDMQFFRSGGNGKQQNAKEHEKVWSGGHGNEPSRDGISDSSKPAETLPYIYIAWTYLCAEESGGGAKSKTAPTNPVGAAPSFGLSERPA